MNNRNKPTNEDANQDTLRSLNETVHYTWEQICDKSKANHNRIGLLAAEFLQLVEIHFREHHSPEFYASNLNVSRSYLRKISRQAFGLSPKNCVYARLMLESCVLFENSQLNVTEIASSLGFDDPAYFSRFFKKQGGIPPDAYRRIALKLA